MAKRWLVGGGLLLVAVFGVLQVLPVGALPENPAVRLEPTWEGPQTRALAERACFDCHSNETKLPFYAWIAPFSWSVAEHVAEGREAMNFSEWDRPQEEAHEAAEEVEEGEMPPRYYVMLHPSARLDAAERAALVEGLRATLGGEGEGQGERDDHEEDDNP